MLNRMLVITSLIFIGFLAPQPAKAGVSILAGVSTPASVGVLSSTKKIGGMFQGRYLKGLLPFVSLGQSVGFVRLSGNVNSGGATSNDVGLSIIPIVTMVQLAPPTPGIKPYVNAGAGLYYVSKGQATITSTLINLTIPRASTTKFGYMVGGGLIYGLPGPVDIQFDASYHRILTSGSSTSFIGLQAGVQIGLF